MTVSAAIVTSARSMLTGWEYVEGAHGRFDPTTGRHETDCQYLVDHVMQANGLAVYLGPELPWEVCYMWAHSTFPKIGLATPAQPGWIVVMGDPHATNVKLRYAHTGIMTSATTLVSALNPSQGVKETHVSAALGMSVIGYLAPTLEQSADVRQVATVVGATGQIVNARGSGGARLPRGTVVTVLHETLPALGACYVIKVGVHAGWIIKRDNADWQIAPPAAS